MKEESETIPTGVSLCIHLTYLASAEHELRPAYLSGAASPPHKLRPPSVSAVCHKKEEEAEPIPTVPDSLYIASCLCLCLCSLLYKKERGG